MTVDLKLARMIGNEPSDLDKLKAVLERERVALQTARDERDHWRRVAHDLDEKLAALKREKR